MITWNRNFILYIIFQALLLVRDPVLPHAVASADLEPVHPNLDLRTRLCVPEVGLIVTSLDQ